MKAIEWVVPEAQNLLCSWHINKNITVHCKRMFEMEETWKEFLFQWNTIINSESEAKFNEYWAGVCEQYRGPIACYLRSTWFPHKERFVRAWADRYLHLGNRATSRVEGAHAMIKKYLQVSIGDLHTVHAKMLLALNNQHVELVASFASERIRVLHSWTPVIDDLRTRISSFAFRKLHEQFARVPECAAAPCTGLFTSSMGLPCAHAIAQRLQQNRVLTIDDITGIGGFRDAWMSLSTDELIKSR